LLLGERWSVTEPLQQPEKQPPRHPIIPS
jgi:hypothetical protein